MRKTIIIGLGIILCFIQMSMALSNSDHNILLWSPLDDVNTIQENKKANWHETHDLYTENVGTGFIGIPSYSSGSINLSGTSDRVYNNSIVTMLKNNSNFTVSAWYRTNKGYNLHFMNWYYYQTHNWGWKVLTSEPASLALTIYTNETTTTCDSNYNPENETFMLTVRRNSTHYSIFINDTMRCNLSNSDQLRDGNDNMYLAFGTGYSNSAWLSSNSMYLIDEIVFLNRSLRNDEISDLMNNGISDTSGPRNQSFNVTNSVGDGTLWNNGDQINISGNMLTFTVESDEKSNMSCVIGTDFNYTAGVENNSNHKSATTNTQDHSYTVFDTILEGVNYLYCSFIDSLGNMAQSGGLQIYRWLVPYLEFGGNTPVHYGEYDETAYLVNQTIIAEELKEYTFEWDHENYSILNSSVVAYFNFENNSAIGETNYSIINWVDGTTCNTTGVHTGKPGKYGLGYHVDGMGDGCRLNKTINVTEFSTCLWLSNANNTYDGSPTLRTIVNFNSDSYKTGFIYWSETTQQIHCRVQEQDNTNVIAQYDVGNVSDWRHYCCIFKEDDGLRVYINGSHVAHTASTGPIKGNNQICIGNDYDNRRYNGTIDDLIIWNVSLGAHEVSYIYNSSLMKYNQSHYYYLFNKSNVGLGNYTIRGYAEDVKGQRNMSYENTFTVLEYASDYCDGAVNASALGCICPPGWYKQENGFCAQQVGNAPSSITVGSSSKKTDEIYAKGFEYIRKYPWKFFLLSGLFIFIIGKFQRRR